METFEKFLVEEMCVECGENVSRRLSDDNNL